MLSIRLLNCQEISHTVSSIIRINGLEKLKNILQFGEFLYYCIISIRPYIVCLSDTSFLDIYSNVAIDCSMKTLHQRFEFRS